MPLMHIPENRVEKLFIVIYTLFTVDLANEVYNEFCFLLETILGMEDNITSEHWNALQQGRNSGIL